MFGIWRHIVVRLRLHYDFLAAMGIVAVLMLAVADYSHTIHGCDLIWWREQLEKFGDKPLVLMLVVASIKLMLILMLTLLSYLKVKADVEPPLSEVKRRFSRFILMRLLAAHDQFLRESQNDPPGRHAAFVAAVEQFRSDARRICERNMPEQQMLPREEREEAELLKRGYRCLPHLREADMYRMVLALSLP
ncbi:hypothetical protein KR093_002883 [Drosophila rubida]|uniref:Uncharacterized protein n=1 Tax=Drosophila rubida TaxID=30044 RepID=A0AAD4JXU3_9MUSC|nr:hypothetical protein KR093_002883 [Drosophila rubida]